MRRGAVTRVVLIGIAVGLVTTAIAYFVPWLPEQGTEQADDFDFVFWFVTAICISIFSVVAAISIYSVWKFRARPDDDSDGPPVHGHTGIEIVWTAVPFVLVTAMAVVSTVALARSERVPDDRMIVEVLGQQFTWQFTYPGQGRISSATLRLPLGVPVELKMTARDVIHSFFVPEFRVKRDLVPGQETKLVFTPSRLGEYSLACYELCGVGHALMRTRVLVMRQPAFNAWVRQQREPREEEEGGTGNAVFEDQGCGSCHTFEPAGSTAEIGPPLDDLEARARQLGREPQEFVRESIVEPDAVVREGYAAGVMPQTYDALSDEQMDALVQYLLAGTGTEGNGG